MPTTSPEAIVDAVLADIQAAGLAPAQTWSYSEPVNVLPANCPLLAVWCEETNYELGSGGAGGVYYERKHTVSVAWYVYNESQAETGGLGDPAIVKSLGATVEGLIGRLEGYAAGMPGGLGPPLVGTLRSRQLKPIEGVVWRALIELVAEEAS